jgi:hypothetical protein
MTKGTTLHIVLARLTLLLALLALPLAAGPVLAQDAQDRDGMPLGEELPIVNCEPGALGPGGEYETRNAQPEGVTRAIIGYQCEEFLTDGTYIPEGYRLQVFYGCPPQECEYPFLFAEAVPGRDDVFTDRYEADGIRRIVRLRANRRGRLIVVVIDIDPETRERERMRYVLDPVS